MISFLGEFMGALVARIARGIVGVPATRNSAARSSQMALVDDFRRKFDVYINTFLERRREHAQWAPLSPERLTAIREEYRTTQRQVASAYRRLREDYRRFLEDNPEYDMRQELYGNVAGAPDPYGDFPVDYPLTEWWKELTFDDALRQWSNADDAHLEQFIDRQRAVLDAFSDWSADVRNADASASQAQAESHRKPTEETASVNLPGRVRRVLYDPWVIAIGSGLLLAVVGVILTVAFIQ